MIRELRIKLQIATAQLELVENSAENLICIPDPIYIELRNLVRSIEVAKRDKQKSAPPEKF